MTALMPRWLQELSLCLASNPQVVLTGNVRDYHVVPIPEDFPPDELPVLDRVGTDEAVRVALKSRGIHTCFRFDPIAGLTLRSRPEDHDSVWTMLNDLPEAQRQNVASLLGPVPSLPARDFSLADLMAAVVEARSGFGVALILDYATWLVPDGGTTQAGGDNSTQDLKALRAATTLSTTAKANRLYNPLIWIVRQQNDLPNWLITSPGIRVVSIEEPGRETRRAFGALAMTRWKELRDEPDQGKALDRFADATAGFTLRQCADIISLAKDRKISPADVRTAQFAYRVGVVESEWEKPGLKAKVRGANCVNLLRGTVKGQGLSLIHI